MKGNEYLFPHRLTRRDFVKMAATATAGLALPGSGFAEEKKEPVRIGSGYHTYELVEDWGKLPAGMKYGHGCGIIVDSKDRIFVTSRSANPCVAIFDPDGKLLETWSNDFAQKVGYTTAEVADTAHCLYWNKEGDDEFIYWTENVSTNKEGPKKGKRVYKTDLKGKILYQIGNVEKEDSTSQKFDWTNPTDVAVAANGDIYVVDGYGSQRVSRFDKNFKHIKTFGTRGKEHGQFNTCHGVWINTLKGDQEVYIADRHNDRIEVFSPELEYKRTLTGDVRNPCCFYQHKDKLFIPDLASRVTILDANDKLVAHLGDGKDKPDNSKNPSMFAAPHALTVDSHGDLYVVEWVPFGRPRKFKHTPQIA
ncbi:twin-arginine translocation signal domain-containing protein [Pedosphaera parvula]|uniref:NHL repeat containing protein n=1 Tax=Pedosphaera parvula (strain Ellin514) TaxID=320771 RepID=B9XQ00_PEDPL|nr:twin-arginine translocation signal domain-containing protein [Pedosphaera parvula]EEF58097.1 NHL repeat containing protein [Pedosphaera parvula Ellin514]